MDEASFEKDILDLLNLKEDGLTIRFIGSAFPEHPIAEIRFAIADLCERGILEANGDKVRVSSNLSASNDSKNDDKLQRSCGSAGEAAHETGKDVGEPSHSAKQVQESPSERFKSEWPKNKSTEEDAVVNGKNHLDGSADDGNQVLNVLADIDGSSFMFEDAPTTFHRPIAYSFRGKIRHVRNWRALLNDFLSLLYEHDASVLESIATEEDARNEKRHRFPISHNSSRFNTPMNIPGSDIWVEGTQSAAQIKSCCSKLLERYSLPLNSIAICMKPSNSRKAGQSSEKTHAEKAPESMNQTKREAVINETTAINKCQPSPEATSTANFTSSSVGEAHIRPASEQRVLDSNMFSLAFVVDCPSDEGDGNFEVYFVDELDRALCEKIM